MPRQAMPDIPWDEAIRRYVDDEQPRASLARRYGVSHGWLRDRFVERDVPIRGHAQAHELRKGLTGTQWRLKYESAGA